MNDTINAFRSYASVKHINLTYESNFRYLNVWLDKDKMDSILKNIISNALKYTPDGGSVHVYACETEDTWSVEVSDTGIGIPLDEQKKLFKMHFRGSNAINSKVTGSGIGLLLVWKLVHIHKGKLNFTSTEGKGSCIKVSFPKGEKRYRKAIHRPVPMKEKEPERSNELEQITAPKKDTPNAPAANAPIEGYEHAQQKTQDADNRQKILVVEDNDELREYLRRTLAENYHVQVCSNGKSALYIVKEYFPDLIISDIMMPEMRGDELCQIVKNDIDTSHIPIILLTAKSEDSDKILGLNIGADDYITKPFNPIEVLARVRSQLRRYTSLGGMAKASHLTNGGIEMDDESKIVTVDGEVVSLTPSEYNILKLLMENPDRVFSSTQIYERIWNEDACGSGSVVAVHIRHLREKIEIDPSNPRYLKVVWGLGYKIEKEAKQ